MAKEPERCGPDLPPTIWQRLFGRRSAVVPVDPSRACTRCAHVQVMVMLRPNCLVGPPVFDRITGDRVDRVSCDVMRSNGRRGRCGTEGRLFAPVVDARHVGAMRPAAPAERTVRDGRGS